MKLTVCARVLALLASSSTVLGLPEHAAVYKNHHCGASSSSKPVVLDHLSALMNLGEGPSGDQFFIDSNVDLAKASYGKCVGQPDADSEMIIILNGIESPSKLLQQEQVFEVEGVFSSLVATLTNSGVKLSQEVSFITKQPLDSLKTFWTKIFNTFKEKNVVALANSSKYVGESVLELTKRSPSPELDEFINEMAQLDLLLSNHDNAKMVVTLDSPMKMFHHSKESYETIMDSMKELLQDAMSKKDLDLTILALPITNLQTKRQEQPAAKVFGMNSKGCFASEAACITDTSSCSSHGQCSNVNGCWKCVCSSTKVNDQTTWWTGDSCSKVDYSAQFNLLFWTGLIIIGGFVGGVKLLYSVGEEEMPGVLKAATVQTKKTN